MGDLGQWIGHLHHRCGLRHGLVLDDLPELIGPGDFSLEDGDLMRVNIVLDHKEDVIWLPPQAIRTFEGRRFVIVQEEGFQQRVDINIGIESDDRIEIEEGLEEGQIVVSP